MQFAKYSLNGAKLLENGIVIGTVKTERLGKGFYDYSVAFRTEAAGRFSDYCNCLSVSEVIEILKLPAAPWLSYKSPAQV